MKPILFHKYIIFFNELTFTFKYIFFFSFLSCLKNLLKDFEKFKDSNVLKDFKYVLYP